MNEYFRHRKCTLNHKETGPRFIINGLLLNLFFQYKMNESTSNLMISDRVNSVHINALPVLHDFTTSPSAGDMCSLEHSCLTEDVFKFILAHIRHSEQCFA